jgi:lipopolysaccharide/colanic/teichoic acid biosynthesis glycosyltransferase
MTSLADRLPSPDDSAPHAATAQNLPRFLLKDRVRLSAALIAGMAGPHWLIQGPAQDGLVDSQTHIGLAIAICLGFLVHSRLSRIQLPGNLTTIAAAFLASYAVIAALFFSLGLALSGAELALSFLLATGVFAIFSQLRARASRPAYAYIQSANGKRPAGPGHADWIAVNTPDEALRFQDLPLVADLDDQQLDPAWTNYIAEATVSGRPVFTQRQIAEALEGKVEIYHISESQFSHALKETLYTKLKSSFDRISALLVLVILSPFLLALCALIRIESHGPAIFRQTRVGRGGRTFTIYKFRSMQEVHAQAPGARRDMTLDQDDRVTRIGQFIRKTRIDELPQLVNILRGEMSWIGPRPETENLSALYEKQIPFYRYRHIVRPGITGWAQVKQGHVTSVTDAHEKLRYDFYYIKNFSIWLDIAICLHTPHVLLTGRGAR